jgi:hypothetical protein
MQGAVQCSVVKSPGKFLVEFRCSMEIEQEIARNFIMI